MGNKTQKLSNVVDQIVEWQSVVVADGSTNTTAVAGRGYFIDTSAGTHTINLPASPKIGDVVKVSLITAGNVLTIGRNGNNINGASSNKTTNNDGDTFELVYANASEGWKTVGQVNSANFITATGGTITESGDFKIHTFTGDGCFVVSLIGNGADNPLGGPSVVDYLVVAGGAAGGNGQFNVGSDGAGGAGGAGGFRESSGTATGCYTASPLGACVSALPVSVTTYPVTVGGGGAGVFNQPGSDGSNSVFSTITSAGGGGGGAGGTAPQSQPGKNGGSGGGAGGRGAKTGGTGNTPPVAPPQGKNGGSSIPGDAGLGSGGGGGATVAGSNGAPSVGGAGGAGAGTGINPSCTVGTPGPSPSLRYFSGGGGGVSPSTDGTGGAGGGTAGFFPGVSNNSPANSGGGAGGSGGTPTAGGSGGSGIVIIRYKFQ